MNRFSPTNWEQAKAVFVEALERSGPDRIQFLDSACGDDTALRAEVESLLRSLDVAGSFMETPAVETAAESLVNDQVRLVAGQRVRHYEIVAPIGEGGMGEVYLAKDLVLGRRVALKFLPEYLRSDPDRLRRFKQEARAASNLSHPNVCVIHEVGETDDGHPFITMEYIEGITLRQRLNEGPVDLEEALDIAIQISDALNAAHDAGVVHRDIKPDNIMIRGDGYVKVLDFGLAKLTEHRKGPNSTLSTLMIKSSPGAVMGTAAYMSPEQARGVTVDARSDIWSLGVVLYEMASGHAPFVGPTPTDVVVAIIEREQPPIAEYIEHVPAELERIVRKALRKDSEERYQIVKEMGIDLRSLQRELQVDRSLSPDRLPISGRTATAGTVSGKQRVINTDELKATRLTMMGGAQRFRSQWASAPGLIALLALVTIAIAGGVFAYYRVLKRSDNKPTPGRFQRIGVTKLTTNGSALFATISPDGKYVAYIKAESGKESLWLRQVGTAGNLELLPARDGHYAGLIFSPDGNFIYYGYASSRDLNSAEIFKVPTLGPGTTAVKVNPQDGPASLSHDGKRIAFVRYDRTGHADFLKVAKADGSDEQVVATRKWPARFSYDFATTPAWTKDDQHLALPIVSNDGRGYSLSIYELRLSDRSEQTVPLSLQRFEQPSHITVLSDGSGVILSGKAEAASFAQIWLLGRDGSARAITNDLSDYRDATVTEKSDALVTVQTQTLSNIFVNTKSEATPQGTQVTSGLGRYFDLSCAPDGKILYASDASGIADIYEIAADGSQVKQLTSGMKRNYAPAVSPDNRFIVFHSNRSGNFQVWRMDRDGSNPVQLTNGNSEANWPQFSSDSKWVFYQHFEPGISGTLWKVPVEGGTPVKVTEGYCLRPVVSPDGKWLGFWQTDGQSNSRWYLTIMSLDTQRLTRSFELGPTVVVQWDTQLRWNSDSKSLTYVDQKAGVENLWAQSIDGGPAKQITNFTDSRIFAFDWSREGSLVTTRGVITSDVVLISDAGL